MLNKLLSLCGVMFLIIPTTALAYHVPTQAPSNLTLTVDYENGTVKADWDASDQMEDYPAERYAIGFGLSDEVSLPYGIATGNVGDSNALNTEFTFTASYLNAVFNEAHGLFHVAIRSDNDTNASYSEWTPTVSITIQNKPSSVTLSSYDMNREDGIKFEWSASTSGFVSASTYKMYYKLSNASEWTLEGQQSNTDYVLAWDNLTDDTYDFMLSACGSENDCNDSNTLTVDVVTYVAPTLGPPMNVTVAQTYNQGVKVDWDVANSGNLTAETYELYFRTDDKNETVVSNITETEYTIPYESIPNGDYTFSVRGYSSDDNAYSSFSTEPTLTVFNQKAQDDADAAAAAAAKKAEEDRIAKEKAEAEAELQRQRDKNLSETGYSETDAERSAREQREYEEEQAKIQAEIENNFAKTGYYETNAERSAREQAEYEAEQQRIADEIAKNFAETGYEETDAERSAREQAEYEAEQDRIAEEIKNSFKVSDTGGGEPLTEIEEIELEILVDAIIEIQNTVDFTEYEVEEEVFEIKPVVVTTTTTTTTTTTIPIKEDFPDEEEVEIIETDPLPSDEGDEEIQLTDEEIEELVTDTEEAVKEIVVIEVVEEVLKEDATEEEVQAAQEKFETAVEEVVKELPKEKKVEVVKEVAKVKVQNLATADKQTKAVVKAVVKEVTKVETVAELTEDEKKEVGKVLGFKDEETAAEDVEIIAEQATKEENVATAVNEYVDRAIENKDVENYTLADVITEVQVEAFLKNPIESFTDVDFSEITISNIGYDMTSDQKEKAQEVVVPVILASQIIAQAGALVTRRF